MSTHSAASSAKPKGPRVILGRPEVLELPPGASAPASHTRRATGEATVPVTHIVSDQPAPESKVAVLACHGMGQQVAYETLTSVAEAIARSAGANEVVVRHVRIGEKRLPRAEVMVTDAGGRPRAVHVYESYWAPLMEGRVSAFDVTRFLFSAGFAGLRHAWAGSFDRWMFGRKRRLPISPWAPVSLLLAFTFVCAGLSLYAALGFLAFTQAGEFMFLAQDATWNAGPLVEAIALELFRSPLALSLVIVPVMLYFRQRPTRSETPIRLRTYAARIGAVLLGATAVVIASGGRSPFGSAARVSLMAKAVVSWASANLLLIGAAAACAAFAWFGARLLARRGLLGLPLTGLLAGLISWTILSAVLIGGRLQQWIAGRLTKEWATPLADWERTLLSGADSAFYLYFLACAVVLCATIRSFYIQYFGDVAAYVSSHTVNKFHEVRGQIRALGLETARAVYGARSRHASGAPEYDRVLLVGHSLGSVVAYDTLNAILNEDATGGGLDVEARTQALVTFGSPLDRTAFIFRTLVKDSEGREALAAGSQPLVHPVGGVGRTMPWINIYSSYDPISSRLCFYDPPAGDDAPRGHTPVQNVADQHANLPAVAHVQYWNSPTLRKVLGEQVAAVVAQPSRSVEPAAV